MKWSFSIARVSFVFLVFRLLSFFVIFFLSMFIYNKKLECLSVLSIIPLARSAF